MARVLGFFVLALILASILGRLPVLGPIFAHTGLFGILIAAGLLSALLTRIGERLLARRRLASELRALGAVETPHNQGKLGSLYLHRGRARKALAPLEAAVRGEPEVAEWRYRLGLARLATRDPAGAREAFEACVAREEEYAYGAARMRLAECLQRLARHEEALAELERQERNHGPSPEAAFRRGQSLRRLGRRGEARAAFAEVGQLARAATRYQRRTAGLWALRAGLARLVVLGG